MKFLQSIGTIQPFLIGSLIFILSGISLIVFNTKTEFHISLNAFHNALFDHFFPFLTHAGDGIFVSLVLILVGAIKYKKHKWSYFFLGLGTFILSGLSAQFLKHVIFPDAYRPVRIIGEGMLNLVENVELYEYNSFPSGHATAAFSLFIVLAFSFGSKKKWLQFLFLFGAIVVSYTRVYLSQHFLEDIVAGATLGILSFLIILGIGYLLRLRY